MSKHDDPCHAVMPLATRFVKSGYDSLASRPLPVQWCTDSVHTAAATIWLVGWHQLLVNKFHTSVSFRESKSTP